MAAEQHNFTLGCAFLNHPLQQPIGLGQGLPSQFNDYQRQIMSQPHRTTIPNVAQMTREDLGIIDQNLDDKIGMEP